MISEKENTKISKLLSLVLRHQPEAIGITLDENGWTDCALLIEKMTSAGTPVTFDQLKLVVDTNAKKRFAFNASLDKIRANQGHSVDVDLNLKPQTPPEILYHGTADRFLDSILKNGLIKQERHHVHLSKDKETALTVGKRHGKPLVLEVLAGKMAMENFDFYLSDNGVWLTENVPAVYLKAEEEEIK